MTIVKTYPVYLTDLSIWHSEQQSINNNFSAEEYYSEELILKNRLNQLKKEEQDVQYEREKLSSLRSLHIRYPHFV